jgi:AcrR family transcriptional regulator
MGRVAAARHEEFAQARREAILNAALKVFAQTGFAEAKMDQVAAAADLSKAALYLYFPSKDALLQSLLQRYALLPELPAMVAAIGKTPPAIGIPTLIREIQSNPERARLFSERIGLPDSKCLADYLDGWMKRGVLRRQHSLAAAQCLFGMLWFFLMTQELAGGRDLFPLSDETVVSTVSRIFLDGAANPSKPSRSSPPARSGRLQGT